MFCQRAGVDKEPTIRLYGYDKEKARPLAPSSKKKGVASFSRQPLSQWQGVLIAYDVMEWFLGLQYHGLIHEDVEWPDDDTLATSMLEYKTTKAGQQGEKLEVITKWSDDPLGYLTDIDASFQMGLVDDVFADSPVLNGKRLTLLLNFLDVVAHTYPIKEQRERVANLRLLLGNKAEWKEKAYMQQLRSWGHKEPGEPHTESYRWCRSNQEGVGGYPCGLWLLFHTMISNSDRAHAPLTLRTIFEWVQSFYGCIECAANFNEEWEEYNGDGVTDHMDTVTWLWKVHNIVRERLTLEDDTVAAKTQWPSMAECKNCYTEKVQNSSAGPNTEYWVDEEWQKDYIFAYIQETFCQGSDTFVCAAFYDPSAK